MKRTIAVLGLLAAATPAMAATDVGLTVIGVGSQQSGNQGYMFVASNTGGCNIFYIDLTTEAGRGMLSIALTARTAGRPIARVDYVNTGGGICTASLIQL